MAPTDRSSSFTATLLSTHEDRYSSATRHAFLAKAGDGTLPDSAVCKWLVQDKYYQLAFVNFIGALLAKLDLFPIVFPSQSAERQAEGEESLSRTTFDLLVDSLTAIRQEIDFYDKTADRYKLELKYAPPTNTTKEFIKLFADASVKEAPLLHGLLVLWATEHCYFRAWTYALRQAESTAQPPISGGSDTGAVAALHKEFIPNWTSEQFHGFVEKLASVTDAWGAEAGDEDYDVYRRLWGRVLQLEANFWPES